MPAFLDDPPAGAVVDPLCFFLRGWIWLGEQQDQIAAIEATVGDLLVGATRTLYLRPDVIAAHRLPAATLTGLELFGHHPSAAQGQALEVQIRARLRDGSVTPTVARQSVTTINRDYRTNHFGILLDRGTEHLARRSHVFATGPAQAIGSSELVSLLNRYLGPAPRRILDVGCGLGYYGRALLAAGHDWLGVEIKASDCAELARAGLPHRQIEPGPLPFADGAFESALCIEVLEHIEDPRAFLAEVHRVAPRQLIVSVPNCELLGYLYDYLSVPWHMLEADHKNFFTRWSLGALLREFYPDVELRFHSAFPLPTPEGTPLHYNLLAIATDNR